ncbi:MAG TPA: DUF4260 family protein [Flavobacteriales bacterium]|nr:DUF4260 family protein [Flavobacteriales bacterium]HIO73211.1 DUF4260 family protein [Flavobacteriales bacterium]
MYQFLLSEIFVEQTDFLVWIIPTLILLHDLGMIGYIINPRVGALRYDVVYHHAAGVLCLKKWLAAGKILAHTIRNYSI